MPWGYVGAAVVSGVMASDASDKASDAAAAQGRIAAEGTAAQLAFEREKYEEWKDIYGDVEQNLADFYENLTPEFLITAGLEDEAESFSRAQTDMKTRLAQRGLGGAGLEAELIAKQEIGSAEKRAQIRRDAPLKVAEMQQSFLQPNLARKESGERAISRAMQSGSDLQNRLAREETARRESDASSLWGSTGSIISAGMERYANQPDTTTKVKKV